MSAFDFFTTKELHAQGHTTNSIRSSIEQGDLERVIKGWYAVRSTDRQAILAMRSGARLGCISALRLHGAWTPPDAGPHLEFPSHASGRRLARRGLPDRAVPHWHGPQDRVGSALPVATVESAIEQAIACQPADMAVAIFDSLLHRRIVTRNRLGALIAQGPGRMRLLLDHLEPRSEEGIESLTRFRLAMAGIHCDVQVTLSSHDRVDLLIDGGLVLELDGRGTHAMQAAFTNDRVRSGRIFRDGRIVLQFAYATIVYDWDFVLGVIRSVMDQHAPVA